MLRDAVSTHTNRQACHPRLAAVAQRSAIALPSASLIILASQGPTAIIPTGHMLSIGDGPKIHSENWAPIADGGPEALSPGCTEYKVVSPPHRPKAMLMHYDMLHRGTGRQVEEDEEAAPWRAMFKFQYTRCAEPSSPSWNFSEGDDDSLAGSWPDSPLQPAWQGTLLIIRRRRRQLHSPPPPPPASF